MRPAPIASLPTCFRSTRRFTAKERDRHAPSLAPGDIDPWTCIDDRDVTTWIHPSRQLNLAYTARTTCCTSGQRVHPLRCRWNLTPSHPLSAVSRAACRKCTGTPTSPDTNQPAIGVILTRTNTSDTCLVKLLGWTATSRSAIQGFRQTCQAWH